VALVQAGQRVRRCRVPRGRAHGARVALELGRALRGPVAGRQAPQRRAVGAACARGGAARCALGLSILWRCRTCRALLSADAYKAIV